MAGTDSFFMYTDSGLTLLFSGGFSLGFKTDLSDAVVTENLFFGSTIVNRIIQAKSNPGVDQIVLSIADVLPIWTANTVMSLGNAVQPTSSNTYRYTCSTAGTTDVSTEPSPWPTTIGATITDGSVVWTCTGKKHPVSEVKLALTEAGLTSAVAGDSLNLGTVIQSLSANAISIWIKRTNTITTVESTGSIPDIGLQLNLITESDV